MTVRLVLRQAPLNRSASRHLAADALAAELKGLCASGHQPSADGALLTMSDPLTACAARTSGPLVSHLSVMRRFGCYVDIARRPGAGTDEPDRAFHHTVGEHRHRPRPPRSDW